VPLYINYVNDARRTEAKGAIGAVITAEQTFYQSNGVYAPATTFIANPGPGAQNGLNCDLTDALTNWQIQVSQGDNDGFIVTATGQGQANGLTQVYTYSRTTGGVWTP